MGEIARHYQIHVKHMYKYWPHLIIDQHCYHCPHTVSSYQHEFFHCGITPQLWTSINSILDSAQLPARLQSIADLPEFLFDAHNPEFNLRRIVNTNLIIVTLKAIWDAYQSKKDMSRQQYRDDIRRRLAMYITNEIKLLPCHLDNAHKHAMITHQRPGMRSDTRGQPSYNCQFREKTAFQSETRFAPLLTTSRWFAFSESNSDNFFRGVCVES